jgi:hypothetical protein
MVVQVALGHVSVFLSTSGFPCHIPPAIFVYVHLNTVLAEGQEDEACELYVLKQGNALFDIKEHRGKIKKIHSFFFSSERQSEKHEVSFGIMYVGFHGQCPL